MFSNSDKERAHFLQYKASQLGHTYMLNPIAFPLHTKQIFFSLYSEKKNNLKV
jgi:hypothetical protein